MAGNRERNTGQGRHFFPRAPRIIDKAKNNFYVRNGVPMTASALIIGDSLRHLLEGNYLIAEGEILVAGGIVIGNVTREVRKTRKGDQEARLTLLADTAIVRLLRVANEQVYSAEEKFPQHFEMLSQFTYLKTLAEFLGEHAEQPAPPLLLEANRKMIQRLGLFQQAESENIAVSDISEEEKEHFMQRITVLNTNLREGLRNESSAIQLPTMAEIFSDSIQQLRMTYPRDAAFLQKELFQPERRRVITSRR